MDAVRQMCIRIDPALGDWEREFDQAVDFFREEIRERMGDCPFEVTMLANYDPAHSKLKVYVHEMK